MSRILGHMAGFRESFSKATTQTIGRYEWTHSGNFISIFECEPVSTSLRPGLLQTLINLIFFQLVWFATVYGPGIGIHWLGLPALVVFASYHFFSGARARVDFILVAISVLIGFVVETAYLRFDVLIYAFNIPSAHFAPYWMLFLWANFALTLTTGLRWLHGRYFMAAGLGFIGAPLAYFTGVKLGAATPGMTPELAYLSIAVSWALVTPALIFLARVFSRRVKWPA